MPNRSREDNINLLLNAFRRAGASGLSVEDAKEVLFGDDISKKSATKKILDEMRNRGLIRLQNALKTRYVIVSE